MLEGLFDQYELYNVVNEVEAIIETSASSGTISWSSSDNNVCTIAQSDIDWTRATITYVSNGTATITATMNDGGTTHTATATVTCY